MRGVGVAHMSSSDCFSRHRILVGRAMATQLKNGQEIHLAEISPIEARTDVFLASSAYLAVVGEQAVLLDLRRDRYLSIAAADILKFSTTLDGDPCNTIDRPVSSGEPHSLLETLVSEGVLTFNMDEGKRIEQTWSVEPRHDLADCFSHKDGRCDAFNIVRFISALTHAHMRMGFLPLERHIARIIDRKKGLAAGLENEDRLLALCSTYRRLRPLYPAPQVCLLDSVALLNFLAGAGLAADLIFGVRNQPFEAHCWLQCADLVLNDTTEHVRTYTPIMVI